MDDHYPSCLKRLTNRWEIIVKRKASCKKQFPDGQTDFYDERGFEYRFMGDVYESLFSKLALVSC